VKHDQLCDAAKKAIDRVHGDTSVSLGMTLESLSDVRDHLDVLIDAVECDLARQADAD
jgi:hypothetical protein